MTHLRRQLDLFDAAGPHAGSPPTPGDHPRLAIDTLDDSGLIAAIPGVSLRDCDAVAGEAVRRRLGTAIPALEALCSRFRGFGLEHAVPEQLAALRALVGLGGPEAATAVARIIAGAIVQGPGLIEAMGGAVLLRSRLPDDTCLTLLRHRDPSVRANAARVARPRQDIIAVLVDLLQDLNNLVAQAAACALGRMGRKEAYPLLVRMLRDDPSVDVIDAVSGVSDDPVIVMLGRVAQTRPHLTRVAISTLADIDHPRAVALASSLQLKSLD
jgi:hypothetical protein